jgi:hypothetical protein
VCAPIPEPSLSRAWRRSAAASRADAADPREALPRRPPAVPAAAPRVRQSRTRGANTHPLQGQSRLRTWPGTAGWGVVGATPDPGAPPTRPRPIGAAQFYNLRRSATRHVIIDGRTRRDLTFHPLLSPTPSFPTRPGRGAASLPCEIAAPPDVTATPRTAERTTPTPTAVRIYTARGPHPKFVLRKPCRRPRRRD